MHPLLSACRNWQGNDEHEGVARRIGGEENLMRAIKTNMRPDDVALLDKLYSRGIMTQPFATDTWTLNEVFDFIKIALTLPKLPEQLLRNMQSFKRMFRTFNTAERSRFLIHIDYNPLDPSHEKFLAMMQKS